MTSPTAPRRTISTRGGRAVGEVSEVVVTAAQDAVRPCPLSTRNDRGEAAGRFRSATPAGRLSANAPVARCTSWQRSMGGFSGAGSKRLPAEVVQMKRHLMLLACIVSAFLLLGCGSEEKLALPLCDDDLDCGTDGYCFRATGDCDGDGTCADRPSPCLADYDPVCGCDDRTYSNGCVANSSGVSIRHQGACP